MKPIKLLLPVRTAGLLLALLVFTPRLFAAVEDDDPWSRLSTRIFIGKVTLQLTNQEIHVTGKNLNVILAWPMPLVSDYVCAVRNPYAQPKLEDGFVQNDASFQVLKDDKDFKSSAFPRFAFFTNRATTIGLLTGHAAANGGSVQQLLLVDVQTAKYLLIPLDEGQMPQWIEQTNYPPAFVTHRQMGYKGWNQSCLDQAYGFKTGYYQRDIPTEQRLLTQKFHTLKLTAAQRIALRQANDGLLDDWGTELNLAQALGDYLYYGTRTGNSRAVNALIHTLKPELRLSLAELCRQIYSESRTNAVAGTVKPAPVPLGDGIASPRSDSDRRLKGAKGQPVTSSDVTPEQGKSAEWLETASYKITIEQRCEEGVVNCADVKYTGVSKKTGKAIQLIGQTLHAGSAENPGHFLGYQFKSGRTTYYISEDGNLEVTRGTKVLVREKGKWLTSPSS